MAKADRKIKTDGVIIVNDYILVDSLHAGQAYGVTYASNEFMIDNGWDIEYPAVQTNMFCDVMLRKLMHLQEKKKAGKESAEKNDRLRLEIRLLGGSTSWRLTKPIRMIAQLFQRSLQPGTPG